MVRRSSSTKHNRKVSGKIYSNYFSAHFLTPKDHIPSTRTAVSLIKCCGPSYISILLVGDSNIFNSSIPVSVNQKISLSPRYRFIIPTQRSRETSRMSHMTLSEIWFYVGLCVHTSCTAVPTIYIRPEMCEFDEEFDEVSGLAKSQICSM